MSAHGFSRRLRVPLFDGGQNSLVVELSPFGPSVDVENPAALLAQHDMLVVGVDTGLYAETLARLTETCHQLVADAETISRQLQREQHSGEYFTPIMAGTGQGGDGFGFHIHRADQAVKGVGHI